MWPARTTPRPAGKEREQPPVGLRDARAAALGSPVGPPIFVYGEGPPSTPTPALHTHFRLPTGRRVHLDEDSEVNDAGGEVEGCLLAAVDHRDAVAVPVAGPWHAALEDGEGQPGRHRRAGVGWGSPRG